jgi:hypothetical protein
LEVRNGSVRGTGWSMDAVDLQFPTLAPAQRATARTSGRYRSGSLQVPFALAAVISSVGPNAAIGLAGNVSIESGDWRIPARTIFSAFLRSSGGLRLEHAKLSASASYEAGATRAPFRLGAAGTLRLQPTPHFVPAAIALRGSGLIPTLDATGDIAINDALEVTLAGRLSRWPSAWPQLPQPLAQSTSPLPFRLRYDGDTNLSDIVELGLRLDETTFDGRFHVADVATWISAAPGGSPLPPLDAGITAPRIDIAGAQLQGVQMTIDDARFERSPAHARP